MHRDFSESEKAKLLGYVKDDQDKNDNRFFGKFIDFDEKFCFNIQGGLTYSK